MRPSRTTLIALALIALTQLAIASAPADAQRVPIVDIAQNDPEMRAAIAHARKTLPEFWDAMARQAAETTGFALKVGLPARNGETEHIWVNAIERISENRYSARLGNEPRGIVGRKIGDRVEFDEAQITDWTFTRNGKMVGNETLRPLLSRMPKGQADELRGRMEKP